MTTVVAPAPLSGDAASPVENGPTSWTPSPGAVWPAIVRYGLRIQSVLRRTIVPPTRNTQVRGPHAWTHARSEPVPESSRFATSNTAPPRPPCDSAPPPAAPGNAGTTPAGAAARTGGALAEDVPSPPPPPPPPPPPSPPGTGPSGFPWLHPNERIAI